MSGDQAQKDVESRRYRLQVRLGAVAREAKDRGRTDLESAAAAMRVELEHLPITASEAVDGAAERRLLELAPRVAAMESELGLMPHGAPKYPKWMRYLFFTGPALVLLVVGFILFERRRRKKKIGDAALAALDRAGEAH